MNLTLKILKELGNLSTYNDITPIPLAPGTQISLRICIGVSFQEYSWIQDFEADFPEKVSFWMLNSVDFNIEFAYLSTYNDITQSP